MPASKSKTKSAAKTGPAPANPAARPLKKGDHLFLVDGSGYIFRAYHALPPLTRKSDGLQVNAVLGFCNMLWKLLAEMKADDKPTHLAVVFDKSEKTFRSDFYPEYKAHRPDAPEDLIPQFPLIRDAVRAFHIPCIELAGYEADDLIATYARLACEAGATATIVSSDKDLMQLVNDCTVMYDTMKDVKIGIPQVIEKFGVGPDKVIEVQSLIGDSSDNVPGVPGIGPKTAAELINTFGDLETVLARASEIKQEKRRQSLIDNAELARISKKLVTLDSNVPLPVPIEELGVHEPDYKNLIAFLKSMGFKTLTQRVAENSGIDAAQVEAGAAASPAPAGRGGGQGQLALDAPAPRTVAHGALGPIEALTPISLSAKRIDALREAKFDATQYTTIETLDALKQWIARAQDTGVLALKTETNALDPLQASLCGVALAVSPNEAAYLPLGHREASDSEASGLFAAKLCDGHRNIPDGEVFTAPVRDSVNGIIQYNCATVYRGVTHADVRLTFKNGKIVEASSNDSKHLNEVFDTDEGARYVGEFAIGFNPFCTKPMKDILFDEKIAGSIHFTPGQCYEETENGNRSAIHWDLVLRQDEAVGGGEIYFDDKLIRKDGRFLLPELHGLNPENLR